MNDSEYDDFQSKAVKSGLTQQAYIINAVRNAAIVPSEGLITLKDLSRTFADLERQLRGLATNVNQMAHTANSLGIIPAENELQRIYLQLGCYRKESEEVWQSIRSLINQQKATGP